MSSSKRRRMEAAQNALHRPFKSPFKRPNESTEYQGEGTPVVTTIGTGISNDSCESGVPQRISEIRGRQDPATPSPGVRYLNTPNSLKSKSETPADSIVSSFNQSSSNSTPVRVRPSSVKGNPFNTPLSTPMSKSKNQHNNHPMVRQLTTHERSLYSQKCKLQADIELLTTALAVLDRNQDEELSELEEKWRNASRSAAEEVWATAREKVNGMGGMTGWRAREAEMKSSFGGGGGGRAGGWGWDDAERKNWKNGSDDDGDDNDERRRDCDDDDDDGREREHQGNGLTKSKGSDGRSADPQESFTMATMLTMLGIDLDVIGYDSNIEGWS